MLSQLAPVVISGFLSLWARPCDLQKPCPLPERLAPSISVSGVIYPPEVPATTSQFVQSFETATLRGKISIYWVYPRGPKTYIVTQIDLVDAITLAPVAQCSSYSGQMEAFPFPVGSCSGFIKQNSKAVQYGVSFSRHPVL